MAEKKKKTRRQEIDEALAQANSGTPDDKPKKAKKENPYPPGSARAKLWDRKNK